MLDALAMRLGLPSGGPWAVQLEWKDDVHNHLRETALTEADVLLSSPHVVIFCECKFTEPNGGKCSQPKPIARGGHKGIVQCDGHYAMQTNRANGLTARCALTAKGIRYWEVIPQVTDFLADADYYPCPFAGPWFQWMRNLTVCHEVARKQGKQPAFVLVYADGPTLPVASHIKSPEWLRLLGHIRSEIISFKAVSFQQIVAMTCEVAPDNSLWGELATWVERKINHVCQKRQTVRHRGANRAE